ncbi:MAG: hypothetical protein JXX28_00710 [Deltaproteobacteria bacterium]|nr:hypothetical protein [Deltaproteobacteria bacterium]
MLLPLLAALAAPAQARDCPSHVGNHTVAVTDTLAVGAEARLIGVGVAPSEGLLEAQREPWDHEAMAGLRGLVEWYPSDLFGAVLEGEVRYRTGGWQENTIPGLDPFRANQAFLELYTGALETRVGLQHVSFGSTALLDSRMMGARLELGTRPIAFSLFGGAVLREMLRSGDGCLWYHYQADRIAWKSLSNEMGDNVLVGGTFQGKRRGVRLRGLYLLSLSRNEDVAGQGASLSIAAPLAGSALGLTVEPLAWKNGEEPWTPGAMAVLRWRVWDAKDAVQLRVGTALALPSADATAPRPVYENLSWGALRRYSLHDERLGMMDAVWPVHGWVEPQLAWYLQSDGAALSDELDLGALWTVGGKHTVKTSAVLLDLAGEAPASPGVHLEFRGVIGD